MPKFSVKKPLTVFVAVIAILVLGVVAYLRMTPDLLPNMDFPYIIIMTTYPGASPEKVEAEVTKPMEQAMSTLEHIKQVSSNSNENYSMVLLEFEDSVNMDTIGVDIQQSITAMQAGWDDMVGSPFVLKINPSMLPIEVAAVAMDGRTTVELTEFLNDTLMNKLEGISGVARISSSGTVKQELHVILDQAKIDKQNEAIANAINKKLDDAADELNEKKEELEKAQRVMNSAKSQINSGKDKLAEQTAAAEAELSTQQATLISTKTELTSQITQLQMVLTPLENIQNSLQSIFDQMNPITRELNELYALRNEHNALVSARKSFEDRLAEMDADEELTEEEKEAAKAELLSSAAYIQLQADEIAFEVKLAATGMTLEGVENRIAQLEPIKQSFEERIGAIEDELGERGIEIDMLGKAVDELKSNIEMLNTTMEQLDAGIIQIKDAVQILSAQKSSGLLEMSGALAELAANSASVTLALTQMESGLETLEKSREDALDKADLNGILNMDMISGILTAQNFAMPAGYVEQDGISYMVSVGDEITDLTTLENLLLFDMGMEDVEAIRLKDVAEVMLTDNRNESYARLDGQQGIVLSFEKQSTYSTAGATNNINSRFKELEEQYPGLHFVALMDQGDYIYMIVDNILNSLLLGSVFAIIILFIFLRDIRPTFITLCSIPLSVVFAIVLMYFSGVTINMISLSGLAVSVGMLVDNSVVVIENIYRLRSKGANVIQAAVSGAGQVAGAVTASTLTTVCVFAPIVFVDGITRQMFTDLALTMTYSLLASLIVSLTLVPAMASGMLKKEKKVKEGGTQDKLMAVYSESAAWALNHKLLVLGGAVVLLVVTGLMSVSKGFIFMPKMDMPSANVSIQMPEETTMEESIALADEVLTRIETVDGIETVGAMMSSGGMSLLGGGGGNGGSHNVTVYITLSDETASGEEVGKQIVELCADMPCEITSSSAMMDMSMLTGSGISLELYGENMNQLQNAARLAAKTLSEIPGVGEVSDGLEDSAPALHVKVDRDKAMTNGITVAQIYMDIAGALSNTKQGQTLVLSGTSTDIVIEKQEENRLDVDALKAFTFTKTNQDGEKEEFTLSDIAEVEETTSLDAIGRKNQRRYLTVTAAVEDGYNVTLLTSQAIEAIEAQDLGSGITYNFTGENESIMEAVRQLMLMLLLGVLLVYLVMVAQFQSLKSPFIVMFTIPLAFTGGFLALLLCGMEVSVISMIGFIMLTGIIVNNGIVLVDYINQLRAEGMERRAAIVEAGQTRMRPILMTSITTILGLIDMAVRKTAGTALMQPMAVVCIGGLLYATIMTLFVVPCIYDMLNKKELRVVSDEDLKLLEI